MCSNYTLQNLVVVDSTATPISVSIFRNISVFNNIVVYGNLTMTAANGYTNI